MYLNARAACRSTLPFQLFFFVIAIICGSMSCSDSTTPSTHIVLIQGLKYSPELIRVHQGDTIFFKNDDIVPHTVSDRDNSFESGMIESNQEWRFIPGEVGTFKYYCKVHPNMTGTIEVESR